jgi:hypothetical protein
MKHFSVSFFYELGIEFSIMVMMIRECAVRGLDIYLF